MSCLRMSHLAAGMVVAGAFAALFATSGASQQQPNVEGSWRGKGQVVWPSGAAESATCQARIRKNGGTGYTMNARCVVSSGAFDQEAYLARSGNRLSGEFHNSSHNVSGSISITINGGNSLSVRGAAGGGRIEVALAR